MSEENKQIEPANNGGMATESKEISAPKIGVIHVPFGEETGGTGGTTSTLATPQASTPLATVSREDILRRARMLAPGLKQCAKLVSRTVVKVLRGQLRSAGVAEMRAQEIAEVAEFSNDCIETIKDSGSRLLAPRIKNDEAADVLALAGAATEIIGGIADVVLEIKKLREEISNSRK